ncbi:MAG: NAD(P)H-hydrate dehydratase [Crocinitomicaceae bacterium]|nr:NAD(P)H-hydrate dehydratase [Crocinitomicaceae bacterium]
MKILSVPQIKNVDTLTIERQGITSLDLMERVAGECMGAIFCHVDQDEEVVVFCGMGNNGGDGLAIARLLYKWHDAVRVVLVKHKETFSPDSQTNFDKLPTAIKQTLITVENDNDLELIHLHPKSVIVDALLGTGVNKPVEGTLKKVIGLINTNPSKIISIDTPSGLLMDDSSVEFIESCVHADLVLTLQIPKLAFLLPDNKNIVSKFEFIDIALDEEAIAEQNSNLFFAQKCDIIPLIKPRNAFSHKGNFGHALLMAGSRGKSGAALLAAESCLRSGAGLLTVHSVDQVINALALRLPEAMTSTDDFDTHITHFDNFSKFDFIGFGPGVGLHPETQQVLKSIIYQHQGKLVIDADGLNILAENKTWIEFLPKDTILTPHPKEFERLVGSSKNSFDRLEKARNFAARHRCILILKDAFTHICMPDGSVVFNSTGNPGLAKGGSGDCLTGIILGLLARGYSPAKAAIIGVFIHGLAADLCAKKMSEESMLISDVIQKLPEAFKRLTR